MNKIVITTINPPTEAILKYLSFKDWEVIIVGDLKTPHKDYKNLNCKYLTPEYQENNYYNLSNAIGWNSSCRRNIGFVEAYKSGAEVIALVDDDNIPYDNWGQNILVGKEIAVTQYVVDTKVADPLFVTNYPNLWHRGFPLNLVSSRKVKDVYKKKIIPMVQAGLWDGDPDVDAIERLIYSPEVKFNIKDNFSFNTISPFNSQNTFLHRNIISKFLLIPGIGRVDDIWGSYLLQKTLPNIKVVYTPPTVYQKRNEHNILNDFNDEVYGSLNALKFITNEMELPPSSQKAIKEYYAAY